MLSINLAGSGGKRYYDAEKRRLATLFGDQAGFADRTYPGYHHYGEIDGDAYQRGISVWCGRLYREAFQYGGPAVSYSEYLGFS